MKVLITGGAGFIGSHLCDELMQAGHAVRVLDNFFRGRRENISEHLSSANFELMEGDIRNEADVEAAVENIDVVYHLAAQSNVLGAVTDIRYSFETNVTGTFNVLRAAAHAGVKRLVFTSSREVYGEAQELPVPESHPLDAKNSYGASKVAGEKYCQVFQNMGEIEVAIIRLANVYGRRDFNRVIPIFFNNLAQGESIRIFGGEQVIDFISVSTVVHALQVAADSTEALSGPTNIGSGRGTTLFDLATRIKNIAGSETGVIVEPARSAEVVKFTAAVGRMQKIYNINPPEDPLSELAAVAADYATDF